MDTPITTDVVEKVTKDIRANKIKNPLVKFAGSFSMSRALIYAFMCGTNGYDVNEVELLAGCHRYGVESPVPIVSKRISLYGNEESVQFMVKRIAEELGEFDKELYGADKTEKRGLEGPVKDLKETMEPQPIKKQRIAGVSDIKLFGEKREAKAYMAPPDAVIAKGIKIKIKDLQE